jgi:hypothetical protein
MIGRKLHTFVSLTPLERRLSLRTIALVAAVRMGLWVLPFRTIQRVSEKLGRVRPDRGGAIGPPEIGRAVRLASRYVPRASCLVQALSTQILLGRHGHVGKVHIGVALDPELGFRAHAWVESQGKILVGGSEELGAYSPMLVLDANGLHEQPKHI